MENIDCLAPQEIKNCRLPKMLTMPINLVDVFKADGTLKTYWDRD